MKDLYTNLSLEEGKHNIILQNRCGNRLTLLCHEDRVQLEFVYKPNAFRRKDLYARSFSTRDNQTVLFQSFELPDIKASNIDKFEYDPFLTSILIALPSGGTNKISFLNIVDENCFAISAASPLTLTFLPHNTFLVDDGLIFECFSERAETIYSFVKFDSYFLNRYRVLDDGRHVIQICKNDVVLVGGEDSIFQVKRVLKTLSGKSFDQLVERNETSISAFMAKSQLTIHNPDFQRVLDINKRLVFSAVDAGGVTHGALQRIYFLCWIRDVMMSTSMFALAGVPDLLELTYPYVALNPTTDEKKTFNGKKINEYLQIVGTRWTKSEDDGLYYIISGLYSLYKTTGDDSWLFGVHFQPMIDAVDYAIATLYDTKKGIFGSDTMGEATLKSSPFYGYDGVNGSIDSYLGEFQTQKGKEVVYAYSLYHNVNMYNILRMLEVLIKESPDVDQSQTHRFRELGDKLQEKIIETFRNDKLGRFNPGCLILADGEELWIEDFRNYDLWEYTWSVSMVPFLPDVQLALESCKYVKEEWATMDYGFCPWNTLSRFLKEYGMSDQDYEQMLSKEIQDALQYLEKYPMEGALTELAGNRTEWKGLPFSQGSLMFSLYSLIIQSLPLGIAVRASDFVDEVKYFVYRDRRINAKSTGSGEQVLSWSINNKVLKSTLQIPESHLKPGKNTIHIEKTKDFEGARLYSSNVRLLTVSEHDNHFQYEFECLTKCELVFENLDTSNTLLIRNEQGETCAHTKSIIKGTNKTFITVGGASSMITVECYSANSSASS